MRATLKSSGTEVNSDASSESQQSVDRAPGIGQNDPGRRQLQIGENTIEVIHTSNRGRNTTEDLTDHTVIFISDKFGGFVRRGKRIREWKKHMLNRV